MCNVLSCLIISDISLGYFNLSRGTSEDDPLFPCLFTVTPEILFVKIRTDTNIKGFKIDNIVDF